ncbi:peptidoglycan-associated lipoprotein Pal [Taklimakanibacter albus]|uniref:Peptidoglycan-associated lipoprotein Pal n=1 Tax=Taklimakanibacter albus TaxID=2800327 RepID=A0ACC5R564_9HYPH|nr:peptidoglycan-associated lipoprotein Pal [Aestuariivirga sp. YIM B02566]MBK1867763.1 peptidoglycan-associated lipoprotein Pal [Aestuariivirga sp. YIM B02566]
MLRRLAEFKIALICCCFLALAACSKKNQPDLEGDGAGTAVPGSEKDFAINVGDRIYFIVDTSTLTPEAQETLRRQAAWLKQYPNVTVQVEGHADERGTREYNISLSARRATATREFLIAQGVQGNRISSIAYGKERPVALCDAEQCYSQNRRAVTVITGGAVSG